MSQTNQRPLPKLVFISEESALIECPFTSVAQQTEQEVSNLAATVCIRCGFWKDAQVLEQNLQLKYAGQKRFQLLCFHPSSPYLNMAKKKLEEKQQQEQQQAADQEAFLDGTVFNQQPPPP